MSQRLALCPCSSTRSFKRLSLLACFALCVFSTRQTFATPVSLCRSSRRAPNLAYLQRLPFYLRIGLDAITENRSISDEHLKRLIWAARHLPRSGAEHIAFEQHLARVLPFLARTLDQRVLTTHLERLVGLQADDSFLSMQGRKAVKPLHIDSAEQLKRDGNNFYLHFLIHPDEVAIHRLAEHFLRYKQQYPFEARQLTQIVTEAKQQYPKFIAEHLPFQRLLTAYQHMEPLVAADDLRFASSPQNANEEVVDTWALIR